MIRTPFILTVRGCDQHDVEGRQFEKWSEAYNAAVVTRKAFSDSIPDRSERTQWQGNGNTALWKGIGPHGQKRLIHIDPHDTGAPNPIDLIETGPKASQPSAQFDPVNSTRSRMTQRDKMRDLFRLHQGNKETVIKAYADAEKAGEVDRLRNASGYGTEQYARALWSDGEKKGWLSQSILMPIVKEIPQKTPTTSPPPSAETTSPLSVSPILNELSTVHDVAPLIDAAIIGDLAGLKEALATGIHPDAKDEEGDTALMLAAYNGYAEIVAALLAAKADPWIKDSNRKTATDLAVSKGHIEVVRLLERDKISRPAKRTTPVDVEQNPCLDKLIAELDGLIGLNLVKAHVNQKINLLKVHKMKVEAGLPTTQETSHMVFSGNPGTGKTTVARLIAEIYKCLGLLNKGHLVEVQAKDLVAEYTGHTSAKTTQVIESAIGGVLFLDEAYALVDIARFGKEAIDTLLPALSNRAHELVVIVAGYPEDMDRFLSSNAGLRRRFPEIIEFDDFSPDDLTQVFLKCAEEHRMILAEGALDKVAGKFEQLYRARTKEFGNAGEAITLFQKAAANQSNRLAGMSFIDRAALTTLRPEDISGS